VWHGSLDGEQEIVAALPCYHEAFARFLAEDPQTPPPKVDRAIGTRLRTSAFPSFYGSSPLAPRALSRRPRLCSIAGHNPNAGFFEDNHPAKARMGIRALTPALSPLFPTHRFRRLRPIRAEAHTALSSIQHAELSETSLDSIGQFGRLRRFNRLTFLGPDRSRLIVYRRLFSETCFLITTASLMGSAKQIKIQLDAQRMNRIFVLAVGLHAGDGSL
jgi:hypothetical protein